LITAIIVGFIAGWLNSMPIGPVNAAIISRTLKYDYRSGLATAIGAAIVDFLYCACAAQIQHFLKDFPEVNLFFRVVGFVALVWMGYKTFAANRISVHMPDEEADLHKAEDRIVKLHVKEGSLLGAFSLGAVLYGSNLSSVPTWIFISGLLHEWGLLRGGVLENLVFAVGAGIGTAGWYSMLVHLIARRRGGFSPRTLRNINLAASIAMLVFGCYFLYQIIFDTAWAEIIG
jgi:threonine/homoserine/homoserine lactone efflux protein